MRYIIGLLAVVATMLAAAAALHAGPITCNVTTSQINYTIMTPVNSTLILYGPHQSISGCVKANITLNEWGSIIIIARHSRYVEMSLPRGQYPYCYPNNVTLVNGYYYEAMGGASAVCTIHGQSSLTLYRITAGIEAGAAVMLLAFFIMLLLSIGARRGG